MTASYHPESTEDSTSGESHLSRRQWLRKLGLVTMVAAGTTALSEPVSAASPSVEVFAGTKPNSVTIDGTDTAFLERYRPYLDLSAVPRSNYPNLYGWRVSSPDHDTDVALYCTQYAIQRDVITLTSHVGDHEWIYVFVDSRNGEVRSVSYSAYHWLRGWVLPPDLYSGSDHTMFEVAPTYHNFIPRSTKGNGKLLDVRSLGDYTTRTGPLYEWLRNGLGDMLQPGAVHNPWQLAPHGPLNTWWSKSGAGRINLTIVHVWALIGFTFGIGIRGSTKADLGGASI